MMKRSGSFTLKMLKTEIKLRNHRILNENDPNISDGETGLPIMSMSALGTYTILEYLRMAGYKIRNNDLSYYQSMSTRELISGLANMNDNFHMFLDSRDEEAEACRDELRRRSKDPKGDKKAKILHRKLLKQLENSKKEELNDSLARLLKFGELD